MARPAAFVGNDVRNRGHHQSRDDPGGSPSDDSNAHEYLKRRCADDEEASNTENTARRDEKSAATRGVRQRTDNQRRDRRSDMVSDDAPAHRRHRRAETLGYQRK